MASTGIPVSPSSSKRSRSRDSTQSGTNSSLNTPAANTPFLTPSVSANSLVIIPSSIPGTPANGEQPVQDATPYPAFLRHSRPDLHATWNRLEWANMERWKESVLASGDQPSQWARCTGDEYAARNRYGNVDPYQANRVRLDVPEGQFDYINASPIYLETTKSKTGLKYIATQGPKAESWSHIWRMIWNENVSTAVIVMLTPTHEGNREKCYAYYPESLARPDKRINEHDEFEDGFIHNLHLASLTYEDDARTEVREIDMIDEEKNESRKVWHLLFTGWPDFSVPEGPERIALLELVEMSRSKGGNLSENPRIVHCSAGIGRSGTFIALDWLMQELEEGSLDSIPDNEDPILNVVEKLRDQRAGMVQAKAQFLFIYDILRERWRERWINLHPSEANKLGIVSAAATDSEPALKRQKSMRDDEDEVDSDGHVSAAASADARAQLEAELMDADRSY